MRKESQHYQFPNKSLPNITHQCQEATKKFTRLNQIKSKNDFLDWLRSLPFQVRYLAVKVEAPGLAQSTRQALRRLEFKNDCPDLKKLSNKSQKNILDSLVFTSDGKQFFDSICFDFSFIEFPQKLYELLMYSGQNVRKFNPIQDMEKSRKPISESCQEIKHIKSKDQLCKTLGRILRHQVFFNTCYRQTVQLNDQKNRKKELSFYWKNLTQELKHQLLYLKNFDLKGLITYLSQKNISVEKQQLQKQIAHLLKLQKNEFCNRIFKCKLKKSLSSITDYHELVYKQWKLNYEKVNHKKKKNINNTKKNLNLQTTKNEQSLNMKQQKKQRSFKFKQQKQQLLIQKQNSIDSYQTNQTQIFQKLEETVIKKTFYKQSYLNDFIEKKIFNDIVSFSNFISKEANHFHRARLIAFQRIKFILQCYGVSVKIFGSCANGIAIKNSDIDIAIDNCIINYFPYCQDQNKIRFALQWLQTIFSSFKCMQNIKFIKNASIPIIKLTLDTSESFQVDQSFFSFDVTHYLTKLNRPHFSTCIQIDITVQTHSQNLKCNHLGLNTTKRINQWIQQIKTLKYMIVIMKYFLNAQQLNCTYKDGINTYGMVVMLVGVIRHLRLQNEQNIVVMLQKVLKFIIYEFDEKVYGIDIRNKKQIFYKKQGFQNKGEYVKADLQILDPQNQGRNMTKKCYKYDLIKNLFQRIQKECFEDQRKEIISSFLKDKKLSFANVQNQSSLKKESLEQITKGMQNPFMSLLKQHQGIFPIKCENKQFIIQEYKDHIQDQFMQNFQGMELLRTQSISG